jgi:hypothetical protein
VDVRLPYHGHTAVRACESATGAGRVTRESSSFLIGTRAVIRIRSAVALKQTINPGCRVDNAGPAMSAAGRCSQTRVEQMHLDRE